MKKLDLLAATLLIVGGLNWGLVAIAEFDLVAGPASVSSSARRMPRPASSTGLSAWLPSTAIASLLGSRRRLERTRPAAARATH